LTSTAAQLAGYLLQALHSFAGNVPALQVCCLRFITVATHWQLLLQPKQRNVLNTVFLSSQVSGIIIAVAVAVAVCFWALQTTSGMGRAVLCCTAVSPPACVESRVLGKAACLHM
jgi:hypothetical protein